MLTISPGATRTSMPRSTGIAVPRFTAKLFDTATPWSSGEACWSGASGAEVGCWGIGRPSLKSADGNGYGTCVEEFTQPVQLLAGECAVAEGRGKGYPWRYLCA